MCLDYVRVPLKDHSIKETFKTKNTLLLKMKLFQLSRFPVAEKTVFLRVDYDVSEDRGNEYKFHATIPTIKYLLKQNCKIVIGTHLGNPKGHTVDELTTDLIAKELRTLLPKRNIIKLDDCIGPEIQQQIKDGKKGDIFVLENLRFYQHEEMNNAVFAHSLAELADVYVNDTFGVCHEKHASVDAITRFLPSMAGLLLEQELTHLGKVMKPRKPMIWVIGGNSVGKMKLIELGLKHANHIIVGGALALAFLRAKGFPIGASKIDARSVRIAKKVLRKRHAQKIVLPIDFMVTEKFSPRTKRKSVDRIGSHEMALDIGPKTIKLFKHFLRKGLTIMWNGSMGYFEWANYATGTKEIGRMLGRLSAFTVCVGENTEKAIHKFHLQHRLNHVSTGGEASLLFLSGQKLPGIDGLMKSFRRYGSYSH
jgi:phosphoglycerate kinase